MTMKNLLLELFVEELPPKALNKLGEAFASVLADSLKAQGLAPADAARAEQNGFYVETAYRITPEIGLFARYNQWDNKAADSVDSEAAQTDVGVNWWLHPQVVVKADYQQQSKTVDVDGFNLGLGWSF